MGEVDCTPSCHRWARLVHCKSPLAQAEEEQTDTLRQKKAKADTAARQAMRRLPFGCNSDHSDEQRIFDMPCERQVANCIRFKNIGNMLYREGQYVRAREQYQRALVYYEYAFPDDDSVQAQLDTVRYLCCLNMAACQLKLKQHREALSSLFQALRFKPDSAKALYRRAQVYRHMDEYSKAATDIAAAMALAPNSADLRREAMALANQRKAYMKKLRRVAQAMVGGASGSAGGGGAADASEEAPQDAADAAATLEELEAAEWGSITTAGSQVDLESLGSDGVSLGDTASVGSLGDEQWASEDEEGVEGGFTSTEDMLRLPVQDTSVWGGAPGIAAAHGGSARTPPPKQTELV